MGSDESHFNVSVASDGQSHKTVSTNHNLFEEKAEPKRYRTKVLPLTARPNRLTYFFFLHLILSRLRMAPLVLALLREALLVSRKRTPVRTDVILRTIENKETFMDIWIHV